MLRVKPDLFYATGYHIPNQRINFYVPIFSASVSAGARASIVLVVVQVVASRDRVYGRRPEQEDDLYCVLIKCTTIIYFFQTIQKIKWFRY